MINVIFRDKPLKLLKAVYMNGMRKNYSTILAKTADCTYSHSVKIIEQFVEQGILLRSDKRGRTKEIKITDKGRYVIQRLIEIEDKLNESE